MKSPHLVRLSAPNPDIFISIDEITLTFQVMHGTYQQFVCVVFAPH